MKDFLINIGITLFMICVAVLLAIGSHHMYGRPELIINDYIEETSHIGNALTEFVVANYDELSNPDTWS